MHENRRYVKLKSVQRLRDLSPPPSRTLAGIWSGLTGLTTQTRPVNLV
jgi:hypothetical protein